MDVAMWVGVGLSCRLREAILIIVSLSAQQDVLFKPKSEVKTIQHSPTLYFLGYATGLRQKIRLKLDYCINILDYKIKKTRPCTRTQNVSLFFYCFKQSLEALFAGLNFHLFCNHP